MRIRFIALSICLLMLGVASIHAATLIVTNTADSGAGSLRDTIAAAAAGDTIQFAAALNGQTITLTSAELLIDKNLTIDGPGANQLTVKRSTVGGTSNFRIFEITPSHTVTIQGLTMSNGIAPASFAAGGGIYNTGSTLTIANSNISGNSAPGFGGGGICNDGVTAGSATLTITNSTIDGNSAPQSLGGGIFNFGESASGHAVVTVTGSTISGNSATLGGGIENRGQESGSVMLTISNSTVMGNSAEIYGGGIDNNGDFSGDATVLVSNCTISGNSSSREGGGISNSSFSGEVSGITEITNSTISDNSAVEYGGGVRSNRAILKITNSTLRGNNTTGVNGAGGAISSDSPGSCELTNSTLSGNSASGLGGGIYSGGSLRVGNTIFDAGTGANIVSFGSAGASLGYNLSSDSGGGYLTSIGDQINTNPMLPSEQRRPDPHAGPVDWQPGH